MLFTPHRLWILRTVLLLAIVWYTGFTRSEAVGGSRALVETGVRSNLEIVSWERSSDEGGSRRADLDLSGQTNDTQEANLLLDFRNSVTADPEAILGNWISGTNICSWTGVLCGGTGQVIQLSLSGYRLAGSVASSLGSLSSITNLDLSSNFFTGNIPSELGFLQNLVSLNLSSNGLEGTIPEGISNCSSLKALYLSSNLLVGAVPDQLGLLNSLEELWLNNNSLGNSIPRSVVNCSILKSFVLSFNYLQGDILLEWEKFTQLEVIYLAKNQLIGSTPDSLGNCSSLLEIDLSSNFLNDTIPQSLGNLQKLDYLSAFENFLAGSIPSSLGDLPSLRFLFLYSNRLEGPIPIEFGRLSNLEELRLGGNHITGPIPQSLSNCSSLTVLLLNGNDMTGKIWPQVISQLADLTRLDIQYNQFSGPIPPEIGNLRSLESISLGSNNLSGEIPGTLSSCTKLQTIDLSWNDLEGEIPHSLSSLPYLEYFNVSFNNLTGPVPDSGSFSSFSDKSFLGNPLLCGEQLERKCSGGKRCQGVGCARTWIYAGVGVFSALAVTALVGCIWFFCAEKRERLTPIQDLPRMTYFADDFVLTVEDIMAATDGFSDSNIIGVGGRSTVYKGTIRMDQIIAVKKMILGSDEQAMHELHRDLQHLSTLWHPNLLRVHALCYSTDITALIVEHMANGSLHKQLHETGGRCYLSWEQRLEIAIGVADALIYLHHKFAKPIIHMNLKPSNILLDPKMKAKLTDYGISSFVNRGRQGEALWTSNFYGTPGYIPPEYGASTTVSTKGDVYNYGVVLLELLTRKLPADDMFGQEHSLRSWVLAAFPDKINKVLDNALHDPSDIVACDERTIRLLIHLALSCTRDMPQDRPTMIQVRDSLQEIKEIQQSHQVSPGRKVVRFHEKEIA